MSSLNIMRLLRILILISLLLPLARPAIATPADDQASIASASDVVQAFYNEVKNGGGDPLILDQYTTKPHSNYPCEPYDHIYSDCFVLGDQYDNLTLLKSRFLNKDKSRIVILTQAGTCVDKPQYEVVYHSFMIIKVNNQWKIDTIYPLYRYWHNVHSDTKKTEASIFGDGDIIHISPKKYGCEWKEGTFEKDLFKNAKE